MPANVTINDQRWQFIAGNKYFVLGTLRFSGTYVTGGIPLSFTDIRNPIPVGAALVKATRAPFYASIPNSGTYSFGYLTPAQQAPIADPPITTNMDINNGLLQIFSAGAELAGAASLASLPLVTGLFIFQGTE